ncbi:sensor domain-containing protein [Mycolicibacterium thermoresistibile]
MRLTYLAALAVLVGVAVCGPALGCTRVVDTPPPSPGPPVAPIAAGQADDLLSPDVAGGEGSLFTTVEPAECAGLAREVDPPFITDFDPAATTGGHWRDDVGAPVVVEEMVGVYRADFDAREALAQAQRTIDSCRDVPFTVTAMSGDSYDFTLLPQVASGSPEIVLWSIRASNWACDNTFVAAHNAAIEITACSRAGGYDALALGQQALERIQTLANTTV